MKKAEITKQKKQYKYFYPQNKAIGTQIKGKDKELIAEVTGHSIHYVIQVLKGTRNNQDIIAAAQEIISSKEQLKQKLIKSNESSV